MQRISLIKFAFGFVCLLGVSVIGPTPVFGYENSMDASFCTGIVYGEWQPCAFSVQYRNVASQIPAGCQLNLNQRIARVRSCSGQVLGTVSYGNGALLRSPDWKIYIVVADGLRRVATLDELKQYAGQKIFNVSHEVIASFLASNETAGQVLGTKTYEEGSLLRGPDIKIYLIINGKLKHIVNLIELRKYSGRVIYNVGADTINNFEILK